MSDVYVVRLTEGNRRALLEALTGKRPWSLDEEFGLIVSARPEHPERQGLLEELAEVVLGTQANVRGGLRCESREDEKRINAICDKLRSLEGE